MYNSLLIFNIKLTIIVGGDEETIDKVMPIFQILGEKVIKVGSLGSGHAIKSLNNMLAAASFLAISEAILLELEYGASTEKMLEVFNHSSGRSYSTEYKLIEAMRTNFAPSFTNHLMYKDLNIALGLANELNIPANLTKHAKSFWKELIKEDYGNEDYSSVLNFLENKKK